MIVHHNTASTNAAWLVAVVQGHAVLPSMLEVTRYNTTFGDCSFAVAAPQVWNSLPDSVRDFTLCENTFAKRLKSHLII